MKEAYDTALALAETIGDTVSSCLALAGIWGVHFDRAEYDVFAELLDDLRRRANVNVPRAS